MNWEIVAQLLGLAGVFIGGYVVGISKDNPDKFKVELRTSIDGTVIILLTYPDTIMNEDKALTIKRYAEFLKATIEKGQPNDNQSSAGNVPRTL